MPLNEETNQNRSQRLEKKLTYVDIIMKSFPPFGLNEEFLLKF